jgi:site-specific DNA-cytosine methylase
LKKVFAIDLCSGAGGWSCAARNQPFEVVAAVDLWDVACQTYTLNHPHVRVLNRDVRDPMLLNDLLDIIGGRRPLVVLGGIPCEWISVYRNLSPAKAAETKDQQEVLDACLSLVKALEPEFYCLEDVAQLIPHLPIMTPHSILNARGWSAQRRKRVFVGNFPLPENPKNNQTLSDMILPGPYRIGRRAFGRTPQRSRTFSNKTTLGCELDRKGPTVTGQCSRRDAEMVLVDPSVPGGMRNFEWQELALLQGFPTDYLFYGAPTDVVKQVGRAIQIDLGHAIINKMCHKLLGAVSLPMPVYPDDFKDD